MGKRRLGWGLLVAFFLSLSAAARANPDWLVETDLPWEDVNPLPENRIEHTHFVHDGYIYLLGG